MKAGRRKSPRRGLFGPGALRWLEKAIRLEEMAKRRKANMRTSNANTNTNRQKTQLRPKHDTHKTTNHAFTPLEQPGVCSQKLTGKFEGRHPFSGTFEALRLTGSLGPFFCWEDWRHEFGGNPGDP